MIKGEAKKIEIDQNGNLKVETEYTLTDGSKTIGHTRYSTFNFSLGMIEKDIKSQCENLMRKIWNLKQNQGLVKTDVTGVSYQCSSVQLMTKPPVYDTDGVTILTPAEYITIDDK
jgi:hypothetical protein